MPYRFLEDQTVADFAFVASGKSLDEMFESAGLAVFNTMTNTKMVSTRTKKNIFLVGRDIEYLLYDWLTELLYFKDTELLFFSKFKVKIKKLETEEYELNSTIWGEKINRKKHKITSDVKAITMHKFKIDKNDKEWFANITIDV